MSDRKYDVAAYIWPSYTGDEPRTRIFWPEGYGEWQTVKAMKPFYPGHTWPRKPRWGYVNEADPFVMEMEIEAAAAYGVNVFIYDWYWFDNRPFLEQCLNNGYLKARNNDKVKFYIMWANHTATSIWDKRTAEMNMPIWDGAVDIAAFETVVHRTIDNYFTHPSYYKIDGKPVYMIYDLDNLIRGLGGIENTKKALDWFREQTVKAGFAGLELQLAVRSERSMNATGFDAKFSGNLTEAVHYLEFDSLTHYQFAHFTNMGRKYTDILVDVKKEWDYIDSNFKMPYYPHISVGWDANPRYNSFRGNVCEENTPENIKKGFDMAKEYVDTHKNLKAPLVTKSDGFVLELQNEAKARFPCFVTGSSICFGAIGTLSCLKNGENGSGVTNLTVYLSIFAIVGSLSPTYIASRVLVFPYPPNIIVFHVKYTSSAVIGFPSDHFKPWRSSIIYVLINIYKSRSFS